MNTPKISILGVYQYDNSVFDGFKLPAGINRQTAIDSILAECAELSLVYSEPKTLKWMIGTWSSACQDSWRKIYETVKVEYDPIVNYDRTEEWTDDGTASAEGYTFGFNDSLRAPESESESRSGNSHRGRVKGNIGVTSTQDLIKQEREVASFNMYDYLVSEFKARFCVLVY